MYTDREELLERILRAKPGDVDDVPSSAVRDLRGGRSQEEVAGSAGIKQAALSRIESGKRGLSEKMALKLAPALGVEPNELMVAEEIAKTQRLAMKGRLDPRLLLESIMQVADSMPDSRVADDLINVMVQVLNRAMETYEGEGPDKLAAATKSAQRKRPDRDAFGRRRSKPGAAS